VFWVSMMGLSAAGLWDRGRDGGGFEVIALVGLDIR